MRQKTLQRFIFVSITALLFSACTISHEYGPYKGKVVDKETGEPIRGAVVFMRFFTDFQLSPGGPVSKFVDAVEVLTDKNGEFEISRRKLQATRFLHGWDKYAPVIIFKPGYGAFPGHPGTGPHFGMAGSIPEGEHVTIKLPKLKTREERKKNLGNLWAGSSVPKEKHQILDKYKTIERSEIGLTP
jgi:hypothetical protein